MKNKNFINQMIEPSRTRLNRRRKVTINKTRKFTNYT